MADNKATFASHSRKYAFSIPALADAPVNLYEAAIAAMAAAGDHLEHFNILGAGIQPAAADYRAATSATMDPFLTVPAGNGYTEKTNEFLRDTWVRADVGAAISAVLIIYWK